MTTRDTDKQETPGTAAAASEVADMLAAYLGRADREPGVRLVMGRARPTRWKQQRLIRVAKALRALANEFGQRAPVTLINHAEQLDRIVAQRNFARRISDPTGMIIRDKEGNVILET